MGSILNALGHLLLLLLTVAICRPQEPNSNPRAAVSRVGSAVCVIQLDGTGRLQLTAGNHGDEEPRWSPDGQRIAFESSRDGNIEIYTMRPDGSDVVRLTRDPAVDNRPTWSPDSSRIAFTARRSGSFHVHVRNAGGSNARQVTQGPGYNLRPSWSLDGSRLVYQCVAPAAK